MKPYYQDDYCTIYHGDCLEILPALPKIDLILADPPYNAKNIGPKHKTYINPKMQLSPDEYNEFCLSWFKLCLKISNKILLTPGIANTHNYPQPKWQLCWHKPAACSFNRMGGYNAWEPIFYYGPSTKLKIGQDFILCNTTNHKKGFEKDHPCPKPLQLITCLITKFAFEKETIVDPFMGSGTTLSAAKNLQRKAIGVEIEEKYCEIAVKRLSQEVLPL